MGIIPKVDQPAPAFIHVDVDDLWAIAACYGCSVAEEWAHHVSQNALPRFAELFREQGIRATFFLVGRDLESPPYVEIARALLENGHQVANHSFTHTLRFRAMTVDEMAHEIDKCHNLAADQLGCQMTGFRAPGYAWSHLLLQVLDRRGYRYDSSLMPGPYGGVFRRMDQRLQRRFGEQGSTTNASGKAAGKTQYPQFSDAWNSLYPAPVVGTGLVEIPAATSPMLRLPFQAGVCMRLGWPYFRACFEPYRWNRALPFVFLFHAADLADFSNVPGDLFQKSRFFNSPIEERLALASRFLRTIMQHRQIVTTEDWLSTDHY